MERELQDAYAKIVAITGAGVRVQALVKQYQGNELMRGKNNTTISKKSSNNIE